MNDSLDFDYEIAFSLLDQDKKIAEELQKRLGNTDKIFLYSTDKKELAFKNAIPVLQNIYKHRSRLVIILHRENYGISSWTLIEKEAIMSRQLLTQKFSTPYSFIILNLDNSQIDYIGRNYIYANFDLSTIDLTVGFIQQKLIELHGSSLKLTPKEIIDNLNHRKNWIDGLSNYFRHEESIKDLNSELQLLYDKIFEEYNKIWPDNQPNRNYSKRSLQIGGDVPKVHFHIGIDPLLLCIEFIRKYSNTLSDSRLQCNFEYNSTNLQGGNQSYYFHKYITGELGWSTTNKFDDYISTPKLVEILIEKFVNYVVERST